MIAERFHGIRERIARAEKKAGRAPGSVKLLPVSKGQPIETLVHALGLSGFPERFGENYLEELAGKIDRLPRLAPGRCIEWHYQGRLQSRKIEDIVMCADVIQTVAREKELRLLQDASLKLGRAPRFFLQVNVSGEAQKNGADPESLPALIETIESLGLMPRWMGLMCLPSDLDLVDEVKLRGEFSRLRDLRDTHARGLELSMGMSQDFEIAIEEGADWVRVGSSLFGARSL